MEAVLLPILVVFFILVITIGIEKASKAIIPLTIIGIFVYFFGWLIFKYSWIFIPLFIFWFLSGLLKKGRTSSNNNRRTKTQNDDFFNRYRNNSSNGSNGTNQNNTYSDTRYYGQFKTRKEAEEFIRNIFASDFGQNGSFTQEDFEKILRDFFGGSTYGNSSGSYRQGGNYQRTGTYTSNRSKYYRILGLKDGASQEEIKKAYRQLAKEHHPDKFVNASDSEKKYHEDKMKEINEAYENLKI